MSGYFSSKKRPLGTLQRGVRPLRARPLRCPRSGRCCSQGRLLRACEQRGGELGCVVLTSYRLSQGPLRHPPPRWKRPGLAPAPAMLCSLVWGKGFSLCDVSVLCFVSFFFFVGKGVALMALSRERV